VRLGERATAADLTTITASDVRAAYLELTGSRVTGVPSESGEAGAPGMAAGSGTANTDIPAGHDNVGGAAEDMSLND
jgi:hypothetical protein